MDIRIQQDLPLPWADNSIQIFLDIENALNLFLGDNENIKRYTSTGDIQEGVRLLQADDGVTDVYEVEDIFFLSNRRDVDDSVYRIQLGFRYKF